MPISKLRPNYLFTDDRLDALRQAVPEAFADGQINWDALREILADRLEDEEDPTERFGLFWPGKRQARRAAATPPQGALIPAPGEGVHEETTRNLFIEGENLEVLKLLQKSYAGQVKMIYIDPPYNTGNDFVYRDDYAEPVAAYLRRTGQAGEKGELLTTNPKTGGRYHSNWLNMIYPRLVLARQLLRDDGVIFVSIDDNEVHNLRAVMNEVFGEENFVTTVIWQKIFAPKNTARQFSADHDYVVVYARTSDIWAPNALPRTEEADARYTNPDNDTRGPWASDNLLARNYYSKGSYEVVAPGGKKYRNPTGNYWRVSYEKLTELDRDVRIWWGPDGNNMPRLKRFISEVKQGIVPQTLWTYNEVGHTQEAKKELLDYVTYQNTDNVFDTPKPSRLIQRMVRLATTATESDVVLDFFAGSCTTAQAVLALNREDGGNRRFICVQFPEPLPIAELVLKTIADVGKERIRRVIARMQQEDAGKLALSTRATPEDLGFKVYKLAPSHFKPWQPYQGDSTAEVQQRFSAFQSPLVERWQPASLLVEIMLQEGFPLDSTVTRQPEFTHNAVDCVASEFCQHRLFICLDQALAPETVDALPTTLHDQDVCVCLDSALTDENKLRLADLCNVHVV